MTLATADISDADPQGSILCDTEFRDFGRRRTFWGQAVTLKVRDDYRPGVEICMEPGHGRVLIIDGDGSRAYAVFGGTMASIATRNGWAGAIVFGAVRDTEEMATYDLGVKALGTTPRSCPTPSSYQRDVEVTFGSAVILPGAWVYADADGILVRQRPYDTLPTNYRDSVRR